MKIVTVLRSGGDYRLEHVERLRAQFAKWAPDVEFAPLTDVDGTLRYDWPGWWCKMAAFAPDHAAEPFLLVDLDTTIVGPLDDILVRQELTVLSDFYWPEKVQSSFMLVTQEAAQRAWSAWIAAPVRHMRECVTRERWGDQGFLEGVWGRNVARWQSVLPGQFVSYKTDVRRAQSMRERGNGLLPAGARVIISHGKPRPWEVGL